MFTMDPRNAHLSYPCVYPANYMLKSEGEQCNEIGLIIEGEIEMIHYTESGSITKLASLKKGEFFGDVLIFSDMPFYIGHLVASTDVKIAYLSKDSLQTLIDKDKDFRKAFIANIARKASLFNIRNKLFQQPTLEDKILFYLDYQAMKQGSDTISIPSIKAWALELNVARPSLSRSLGRLEKTGALKRTGTTYKVDHTCILKP